MAGGAKSRRGSRGGNASADGPAPSASSALLYVAAAWAVPGLGHFLLGRTRRAVLFAVLVLGSFGLGLAHEGQLALVDRQRPFLSSMQLIANLGLGPFDMVARIAVYGAPAYSLGDPMLPRPRAQELRSTLRQRARSESANYGTLYLLTAGLMNLLLLFDVWDIGRGRKA